MVTKITDYSTTAGSNTDVAGISLAEGWAPSTVNNLMRALIAQMAGAAQSEGGWLELQTSITAGTTQTIAGAYALTSPLSHVTTCANASDGVALPANVVETQITIVNGGAYDLKIWPNNGASDTINGGSADAADANLLAAGDSRTYTAINGTNWVSHGVTVAAGADAERAMAGVLQTNANFVDQVIFGPSVDGVPWNGAWSKASVYSSLMLATIEDEGSNTEINIWDLTEQTSGAISTTPLATVDLASAATPTSIAASMGYLIVGSEDGIAIIDPHSGAWAERTTGWPKTLSTSTAPALTNNDIQDVAAGLSKQPVYDPRTGGSMPTFAAAYAAGSDQLAAINDDGTVTSSGGTAFTGASVAIMNGRITMMDAVTRVLRCKPIELKDNASGAYMMRTDSSYPQGFPGITAMDAKAGLHAMASTSGFSPVIALEGDFIKSMAASINRTYNTGYLVGDIRGAWLANNGTSTWSDRSYKANTLTETGTIAEAAVESGAELMGYSGFEDSNNFLRRAYDADFDFGTGSFSISVWFKRSSTSGEEYLVHRMGTGAQQWLIHLNNAANTARFYVSDGTNVADNNNVVYGTTGEWIKLDAVWDKTTEINTLYVNGVAAGSVTQASMGDLNSSDATLTLGATNGGGTAADNTTMSLFRISATAPTPTQIRQMYEAEKGMFVASAECLLQSGSTDAVLDVDVDPLSSKVIVTQTDAITVFDGLVVDSKPTVNSGASEKGKLWGDLRAEQNAANAYVTAPAVDQRQVNEMVRGLANEMPAGVDLSKAKAWCVLDGIGTIAIKSSFNVKSVSDENTGQYKFNWAVPFKSANYSILGMTTSGAAIQTSFVVAKEDTTTGYTLLASIDHANNFTDVDPIMVVAFGELENE
jgi:hypothetical protein